MIEARLMINLELHRLDIPDRVPHYSDGSIAAMLSELCAPVAHKLSVRHSNQLHVKMGLRSSTVVLAVCLGVLSGSTWATTLDYTIFISPIKRQQTTHIDKSTQNTNTDPRTK